jgi:hypothetical protein
MANVPISNLTTTWNNVATTFTGIKLNVTDTASAAASLLMDLQVGGSSQLSVAKNGDLLKSTDTLLDGAFYRSGGSFTSNNSIYTLRQSAGNASWLNMGSSGILLLNTSFFGWVSSNPASNSQTTGRDLTLFRDAANTLAQRNGTNAQTFRVYGTFTDVSNYRRLTSTMSTGGVAEIKPEGAGTGASGNVLHISGLPTSNPGPGILWNNLGIVNVGT